MAQVPSMRGSVSKGTRHVTRRLPAAKVSVVETTRWGHGGDALGRGVGGGAEGQRRLVSRIVRVATEMGPSVAVGLLSATMTVD
jgi:hypothetical protein